MASGMDVLITATDKASAVLEGVGESGANAADNLEISWGKVALAITGAAAAIEMSNRSMQGVKTNVYQMAVRLGITRDAANELTRSISDVGFSLEDASAVMTSGIRQGLNSAGDIKKYSEYWEMVSRASGEAAPGLAESGKSMGALGIRAGNVTDSMKAFDFIIGKTDLGIGFFLDTIGKSAKQLQDAHVGLNDVAEAMGFLESKGYSGRAFMSKFKAALDDAEGSRATFFANLGMNGTDLEKYAAKLNMAIGSTNKLSDAQKDTYTGLQRVSQYLKELQLKYEGLGTGVGNVANVFGALADGGIVVGAVLSKVKLLKGGFDTLRLAGMFTMDAIKIAAGSTAVAIGGITLAIAAATTALAWLVSKMGDWLAKQAGMYDLADKIKKTPERKPGESANDYARRLNEYGFTPADAKRTPEIQGRTKYTIGPDWKGDPGSAMKSSVEHKHSGTVTVRGVNDKDQLVAVANLTMENVLKELNRGNRTHTLRLA